MKQFSELNFLVRFKFALNCFFKILSADEIDAEIGQEEAEPQNNFRCYKLTKGLTIKINGGAKKINHYNADGTLMGGIFNVGKNGTRRDAKS